MTAPTLTHVKPALQVFLSYATADRDKAARVRKLFSQRSNIRVFSEDQVSAGDNWRAWLKDAITKSDVFVVLVSPISIESPWVLQELGAAWALEKPIIPVVTDPELFSRIPVTLRMTQAIDLGSLDDPGALDQILAQYNGQLDSMG